MQRKLSNLLQDCVEEINAKRKFPDQLAHGFKRDHSIVTNAVKHRRKKYVFNMDLEDFFGTINAQTTRLQYRGSRQDVTGLVVDKKVNIRRTLHRSNAIGRTNHHFGQRTALVQSELIGTLLGAPVLRNELLNRLSHFAIGAG